MRSPRPTPLGGRFAGLLALIAFALTAVAMTAGGPSSTPATPTQAQYAQPAVVAADAGRHGWERFGGGDADPADRHDGDEAHGRDEGPHHR